MRIKQYGRSFNPTGQCKRRFSRIKSPLAIAVAQGVHFWLASSSVYLCVADTDWFTSFPPFAARPSVPCFIHSVWLTDIVRSNFQSFRKHDLPAEVLSYRWLLDGTWYVIGSGNFNRWSMHFSRCLVIIVLWNWFQTCYKIWQTNFITRSWNSWNLNISLARTNLMHKLVTTENTLNNFK